MTCTRSDSTRCCPIQSSQGKRCCKIRSHVTVTSCHKLMALLSFIQIGGANLQQYLKVGSTGSSGLGSHTSSRKETQVKASLVGCSMPSAHSYSIRQIPRRHERGQSSVIRWNPSGETASSACAAFNPSIEECSASSSPVPMLTAESGFPKCGRRRRNYFQAERDLAA